MRKLLKKRNGAHHREARLRRSFAKLYPGLPDGDWHPAQAVRCLVLHQHRLGSSTLGLTPRVLDDAHFDFRGASDAVRTDERERRVVALLPEPYQGDFRTGAPAAPE